MRPIKDYVNMFQRAEHAVQEHDEDIPPPEDDEADLRDYGNARVTQHRKTLRRLDEEKAQRDAREQALAVCINCPRGVRFVKYKAVRDHTKSVHKNLPNICHYCGNGFKRKRDLDNHNKDTGH